MKKVHLYLSFTLIISASSNSQQYWTNGRLKVSENGHFIVYEDGTPFLWLGDTGWELFQRLDRNEAVSYLKKREEQGFDVIQAILLSELGGLIVPNSYGSLPLISGDPSKLKITPGNDTIKTSEFLKSGEKKFIPDGISKELIWLKTGHD